MSNDKKTLADAQPGGRVRLGDQAERARFEAWHCEKFKTRWLTGAPTRDMHNGVYADNYGPAEEQVRWEAWQAALSAQPSPGVQDALATARELLAAEYDKAGEKVFADRARKGRYDNDPDVRAIVAALAARQPSKQPDSVALGEATEFCIEKGACKPVGQEPVIWVSPGQLAAHKDRVPGDGGAYLPARLTRDGQFTKPIYASPSRAMDLGPVREALQAAARSLRTIADSTKDTEFLETTNEIRAYANSRAICAEQAVKDSQAVGNG